MRHVKLHVEPAKTLAIWVVARMFCYAPRLGRRRVMKGQDVCCMEIAQRNHIMNVVLLAPMRDLDTRLGVRRVMSTTSVGGFILMLICCNR